MKTLKKLKKIKLQATEGLFITGGCVERCVEHDHTYVGGVDYGPGLVCTYCY